MTYQHDKPLIIYPLVDFIDLTYTLNGTSCMNDVKSTTLLYLSPASTNNIMLPFPPPPAALAIRCIINVLLHAHAICMSTHHLR